MRQNPHVRICGGPGSATTLVYPTTEAPDAMPNEPDQGDAISRAKQFRRGGCDMTRCRIHERCPAEHASGWACVQSPPG